MPTNCSEIKQQCHTFLLTVSLQGLDLDHVEKITKNKTGCHLVAGGAKPVMQFILIFIKRSHQCNPLGINRNFDNIRFYPYFSIKDLFG